ncbi:methyl-accepting chemotaxis protein [Ideonella sp. DXS22W]|uniref:Methyl-accepting chemotaxis protein n=1 Tax=Pseudaquabacterium inlustre TaxID=2984192 RepID=A0ABU9CEG8_9BURK
MNSAMQWMRGYSIRFRMRAAIAVVLGLFGLVGLAGLLGGRNLGVLNQDMVHHSMAEQRAVADARFTLAQVRRFEQDAVIHYEDGEAVARDRKSWQQTVEALKSQLGKLLEGEDDADNPHARAALKAIEEYATASKPVFDTLQAGNYDNARTADRMLARAKHHFQTMEAEMEAITVILDKEAKATQQQFDDELQRTTVLFVGVLAMVVLVVVPTTLLNSQSITGPIVQARAVAQAIASGDLTQRIVAEGSDEAADLLRGLASMQDALRTLVGELRDASGSIQRSSGEMAAGNLDLSGRTEQAASSLQQAASSLEQITDSVRQSAESSGQASALAQSAQDVAQRGGSVVQQVVATMDQIHSASSRIADITGVIDGIAFQTNILALNAAVEAARAGEQGRGFAVVAGEVRSLAQRSAEAAREIKSLIGASVERVSAGAEQVREAGRTMDEIVDSVQRVSRIIAEVTTSADAQSQGIGEVSGAVTGLDRMTQQNASLVEQTAAAAESLSDQAKALTGIVGRFRIESVH